MTSISTEEEDRSQFLFHHFCLKTIGLEVDSGRGLSFRKRRSLYVTFFRFPFSMQDLFRKRLFSRSRYHQRTETQSTTTVKKFRDTISLLQRSVFYSFRVSIEFAEIRPVNEVPESSLLPLYNLSF